MKTKILAMSLCLFMTDTSYARKFDFKSQAFSTYIKGSYGLSNVGGDAFQKSSGSQITGFSEDVNANWSGEFGFVFAATRFAVRLGAELLLPRRLSDVSGATAAGVNQFTIDSQLSALIPVVHLEIPVYKSPSSRAYLSLGGGYANVSLKNDYDWQATNVYTIADYTEKASGTGIAGYASLGYELLFADNSTIVFDLGYRHLPLKELRYDNTVITPNGTRNSGAVVVNNDGRNREIDLSGAFAGLSFRFYLGL